MRTRMRVNWSNCEILTSSRKHRCFAVLMRPIIVSTAVCLLYKYRFLFSNEPQKQVHSQRNSDGVQCTTVFYSLHFETQLQLRESWESALVLASCAPTSCWMFPIHLLTGTRHSREGFQIAFEFGCRLSRTCVCDKRAVDFFIMISSNRFSILSSNRVYTEGDPSLLETENLFS